MSESLDIVDTSDVEEREFSIVDADFWASPVSAPVDLVSPQNVITRQAGQTLSTHRNRISDSEVENSSPRKRIKIVHNAGLVSPSSAYPIAAASPLLSSREFAKVAPLQEIPASPQYSPEDVLVADDDEQASVSSPSRHISPHTVRDSLFSSPSTLSVEYLHDATSHAGSHRVESPSGTSHRTPRSFSVSTNHYSFPRRCPTTPPQTSSQNSHNQSGSGRRMLHLATSSPLTPVPSPARFLPSPSDLAPAIPRVPSPSVQILDDLQPATRYALRRREARQLNPYAYDKLLYKQQLKFHPDAIVKFPGPRRHSGSNRPCEDGTQDDFVFPVDNPDEDGDYVDVGDESSSRRRRRRAESLDRNNVSVEDGQGPEVEKGWLPEIFKELSSSDEDDTEIAKLARRIRREREKAEALARAEARRADMEARLEGLETKKSTKQKPKPFPLHGNAEHVPERGVPGSSPSPSLFSRAHSGPTMVPHPPSSSRVLPRSATPSGMPSHPPTSSLNSLQPPNFGGYLQQEDSYRFDDYDLPLPWISSPVDHSDADSAPPTPSGSPTTSSAARTLPSNTSGIDSEPGQSTALEMNSKDRKRLRALKRMMPAAMIARELGVSAASRVPPPRARITAGSSGSEDEEARVIPGLARARKGRYKDVEVKGDPESSDVEHPTAYDGNGNADAGPGASELFSDGQSVIKVVRTQRASPRREHEDDVISLSDSSSPESSSEDSENGRSDGEQAQSLFDRPERGPARERSLIDWMLCRKRTSSRPKFKNKQPTRARRSRGRRQGVPKLNIVTSGARRYGEHHQTLLPFVRADSGSNATSSKKHASDRVVQMDQDSTKRGERLRNKKRQSRTSQGLIYNVHHDATRITSKNRGRTALVIQNDDNEFRHALDPGWRAEVDRWNKPVSPAPQPVVNSATNAPAAPRPRLYRRTSPQLQSEAPLPFYFQREKDFFVSVQRRIVVDMNITPLPSGVKFGASSYIGKGLLHQLILDVSGKSEIPPPIRCNVQGLEIGPTTSAAVFSALLGPLCDHLASALRNSEVDDVDKMKEWEPVTRASSQIISWFAAHAEDQEFVALEVALREYSDGLLLVLESLEITIFSLAVRWFVVELSARLVAGVKYRRGSAESGYLVQSIKQLMQRLLGVDLRPAFLTFHAAEGDVDITLLSHRAAELWVCLIHLLSNFQVSTGPASGRQFWRLLEELHPESSPTGAEASEDMWHTIFSLCAISQFSVHGLSTSSFRLPEAWELVAIALKKIILTSNAEKERQLPPRALRKRDDYISCIVSRCFLLWSQWGWRLDGGIVMFKSIQEIFRSRNFANLLNEHSAPMGFLENADLELLSKRDRHDTVFEIFLKMVVQAVYLLNTSVELDAKQRSLHIKKLLQMAVPVSPVPFSRTEPPSTHSLSMLVNRFSAMVIAVHLDPTSSNVKFRIGQARRCVTFKDADDHSRLACVYGMMNFAMIVRHHKIAGGLQEVLGWLEEMADVLMDEYKEGEIGAIGRKRAITLIQLLIGSVRRVIETPSLDKGQRRAEYPDPALLDGPWVTRLFNPRTDLVTIQQTGVEIRMLVQSFLDARLKVLPVVQPPPPAVVHNIESQESQDEYDKLPLDLNDEELLAALGDVAEASTVAELKSKEDALCKVLDRSITPAVYRLVCKYFSENEHTQSEATSDRFADEWIDCWVGCANVLVQNKYKDWGLYMKLGQQSWEKIIDDSWRRRVGLRFTLTLLRLDPVAYNKMKDDFIAVLLASALSYRTTIEHEFMSVVLSLDGLRHPLLHAAPVDPIPGTKKYEVSEGDYEVVRERLIGTVFANVAGCLRAKVDAESQTYVEMVVTMLSTMRDIYQTAKDKAGYRDFCRRVFRMLLGHLELVSHARMSDVLGWGKRLEMY